MWARSYSFLRTKNFNHFNYTKFIQSCSSCCEFSHKRITLQIAYAWNCVILSYIRSKYTNPNWRRRVDWSPTLIYGYLELCSGMAQDYKNCQAFDPVNCAPFVTREISELKMALKELEQNIEQEYQSKVADCGPLQIMHKTYFFRILYVFFFIIYSLIIPPPVSSNIAAMY